MISGCVVDVTAALMLPFFASISPHKEAFSNTL